MLDLIAIVLVLTALIAYVNRRFIRLPPTIGVMVIALSFSSVLLCSHQFGYDAAYKATAVWLGNVNFSQTLLQGMLSVLLFAGALHVDVSALRQQRLLITVLAVFGTLLSSLIIGFGLAWLAPLCGVNLSLANGLLFGALISPTDPVAVLSILKTMKVPRELEVVIVGESLFNDGVGIVLFAIASTLLVPGYTPKLADAIVLVVREAGGGLAFGALLGFATYSLLRAIDSYQEEVLITLATVVGGYAVASHLHISGPLAMVVAGLIVGHCNSSLVKLDSARPQVEAFWELLDALLNAVLFVLVGMVLILIPFHTTTVAVALLAVIITMLARMISVAIPIHLTAARPVLGKGAVRILTWGGLRGGISLALALSLPAGVAQNVIVTLTYAVVVFSVLIQGGTLGLLAKR